MLLLAAILAASAWSGGCHRRRPRDGTCAAHIDCEPGQDCVGGRCRKRAAAPGTVPAPPVAGPAPAAPPPDDTPATAPAPETRPTPRPRPAPEGPSIDNAPAPPPPDLPAWKARLKSI